ncbi:MAG: helix-turn-helix domain-containing protein [Treponema sp.]|nr:helix-turn-helix domain-containing protein [Treponema sp.]
METNHKQKKERLPPEFIVRIEKLLHDKNMTKNELIRQAGLNSNVFSDWKHQASYPNSHTVLRISKILDTSVEFLLEGKDNRVVVIGGGGPENGTFVPVLSDELFPPRKAALWIPAPEWLESAAGPKVCVRVSGDYMEPTIPNGSVVICSETSVATSNGLYAVSLDGQVSVKRLSQLPHETGVACDNTKYPSYTVKVDEYDKCRFMVVGRVLGILYRAV